ncbi:hypothetical protein OG216_25805 [Streptomycetaceae bacterium NBC_01309]
MLVHVFRVPHIEGGARIVVDVSDKDLVIFILEKLITEDDAKDLQAGLNADLSPILARGELLDLGKLVSIAGC